MAQVRVSPACLVVLGTVVALPIPDASFAGQRRDAAASARLRAQGLELGFNLDHADALKAFTAAIEADPADPAPRRLAAATLWIAALFQQGAVTAEDYLGHVRATLERTPPPPDLAAAFRSHLDRATALAEERLRADHGDANAHFQVGAAYAFRASYTATIEGRVTGGFGAARRAYRQHRRVLEIDPARKDAGLVVGMYRYAVSLLPWHWRLLAGIAGFDGGRERGLRLVEEAAAYPSDVQSNALFSLIVLYNREERYDDALRVIAELKRRYPRNRLLWLEAGTTALRAGRHAAARAELEQGLARLAGDPRPKAFGEDARWRHAYAAALAGLNEAELARRELRAVLAGEAPGWLHARARKDLERLLKPSEGRDAR